MTSYGSGPSATPLAAGFLDFEVLLILDDSVEYRYAAACPALPGCVSDGRTRDEALEMITEAINLYLSDLGPGQSPAPQPDSVDAVGAEYVAAGFSVETVRIQIPQ